MKLSAPASIAAVARLGSAERPMMSGCGDGLCKFCDQLSAVPIRQAHINNGHIRAINSKVSSGACHTVCASQSCARGDAHQAHGLARGETVFHQKHHQAVQWSAAGGFE